MTFMITGGMVTFTISGAELASLNQWLSEHDKTCKYALRSNQGAIGGRLSFTFASTSIGEVQKVKCACGEEKDLTDYGSW